MGSVNQGFNAQTTDLPPNKGQWSAGVSLAGATTTVQYAPLAGPTTATATSAAVVPGLLVANPFQIQGLQISYIPQGNAGNQTFTAQIYRTPAGSPTRAALANVKLTGLLTSGSNATRAEASVSLDPSNFVNCSPGDLLEASIQADVTFSTQITNISLALK